MNDQAIRFRIGIFVLAALIALGVLVILFGGRPYYFLSTTTYTVQFDNAQGIAPGTPVRRSGVKIGEVRRVKLDDDTGKVEVVIQIDDGFKLRKSDRPTLTQSILGGDAVIAFLPPANKKDIDNTPVEAGAVLEGVSQADAGQLISPAEEALKEIKSSLEKLTPTFVDTLRDIRSTARSFERLTPGAEDALREIRTAVPKTSDAIQDTAKKLTPNAEKVLEKIDKALPIIERAFDKIDKMAPAAEKALAKIEASFDKIDKMVPGMEKTLDEFRTTLKKLNPGLDEFTEMAKTINKNTLPDLRRTSDEIQVLARNWNKVGERLDLFLRTNEDKLARTVERMEEALKRVNDMFSEENQRNIRDTLRNVRAASDRFDGIAKNTDELLKDGKATLKTFNDSLLKVDAMVVDLQKATKPLAERSDSIFKNIDQSTEKLNHTLTDVRELLQKLTRGDGTLHKLLADPTLYNNLNEASLSLSRAMPRLDHILRDVEIFADKLARHPELLGIRGAIAPGAGTKEAPAPYHVYPFYYP
jgi:ABC-type transporter Mla subunit MlaD